MKIECKITCGLEREMVALMWSCSWMLVQMRDEARLERLLQELFEEADLDPIQVQSSLLPLYYLRAHSHCFAGHYKIAVGLIEQVVEMRRKTLAETSPSGIAAQHTVCSATLNLTYKTDKFRRLLSYSSTLLRSG